MMIDDGATINYKYNDCCKVGVFGRNCHIRSGAVLYCDIVIGDYFQSGHNVLIREGTVIGDHVVVGTNVVIDGNVTIGSFVKIETGSYIPTHVVIGSEVFIGPNCTLTNDKLPLKKRDKYKPDGPTIADGVTLGAGVVVLPGVTIGEDSFIAAGSIVSKDIPANSLVIGASGKIKSLPENLRERNIALSWMKYK